MDEEEERMPAFGMRRDGIPDAGLWKEWEAAQARLDDAAGAATAVSVPARAPVLAVAPAEPDTDDGAARAPALGQEVIVPLRHRNDGWTPIRQRAFLRLLSELGSATDACKRVGMSTTSAHRLRKKSPDFAAAWDRAASIVAPILEQAAYERGVEGWDEPVYQFGRLVGYKRRYSDAALKMLMQPPNRGVPAVDGVRIPDFDTATPAAKVAFAELVARKAGGYFARMATPDETDAALRRELDVLDRERAGRRRQALARGAVWVEAGAYPAGITVDEAAARDGAEGAVVADGAAPPPSAEGAHGPPYPSGED